MINEFENYCWKDVLSSEALKVYQTYRRKTYIGNSLALLIVDLYKLAFEGGAKPLLEVVKEFPSSCGEYAWNAIRPIKELIALARKFGIPVIYTTGVYYGHEKGFTTMRQFKKISKDQYEIWNDFMPEASDLIIYKERASAFFGTNLISNLIQKGIKSLIVCGQSTSGCVRASVVDAFSYGFHIVIVEECCFDRNVLSHKINLFDLHHKYADVMRLDEVKNHFTS